jgi:hypothetical protein
LFRPEESNFKYSKYTPIDLVADGSKDIIEVIGTIPRVSDLRATKEDVVEYNNEYYIKVSVTGEDGKEYSNYYNYSKDYKFNTEETNNNDNEVI